MLDAQVRTLVRVKIQCAQVCPASDGGAWGPFGGIERLATWVVSPSVSLT